MSIKSADTQIARGLKRKHWFALPQANLALTIAERKFLLVFIDLLLINAALLAAVIIWNDFVVTTPHKVFAHYKWFVTLSIVWLGFGTVFDIYNLARSASTSSILASASLTVLLTGLVYVLIPWLTPPIEGRGYLFGFLILSLFMILGWRLVYANGLNHPAFQQRALILGDGETAQALKHALNQVSMLQDANPFRSTGYQIVGLLSETTGQPHTDDGGLPLLGNGHLSTGLAENPRVDEVIVALDDHRRVTPQIYEILLNYREAGRRVSAFAEIYERLTGRLPVNYDGRDLSILLGPHDTASARLYLAVKQLLDVLLALVGLIPLALVIPWVVLGNVLRSPGPLFYQQERVGKGGKPFTLFKFRTMIPNAEKHTGAVWSAENDPRITPVGRWLRKTRLDELPQIINVLRGEMSIVGPRPERPSFVGQLSHDLPLYRARHSVKPGITGWAQVHYEYGNSVEDSRIKLEYDLYYVKHASLYLDLLTMLQTLRVVLLMKGM